MSTRDNAQKKEEQIQRAREVLNSKEFAEPSSPTRKAILYKERQRERNYPEISISKLCEIVGCTTTRYYRKLSILRNGFPYENEARFNMLNRNESMYLVSTLVAAAERGECICLDRAIELGNELISLRNPAFQMDRSLSKTGMRHWVREHNLTVSRAVKYGIKYASSRLSVKRLFLNFNFLMETGNYPRSLIVNMDEVLFPTESEYAQGFVIHPTHLPPLRHHSPSSSFVTMALAISAGGDVLKPCFVTPKPLRHVTSKFFSVDGPVCFQQPSGFMTGNVFIRWIKEVLLPFVESRRTSKDQHALLVCRAYASRINICAINVLKQYNIDLLVLPTHAVSRVQPLNLGVFPTFQKAFDGMYKENGNLISIVVCAMYSFKLSVTAEAAKKGWNLSHLFDSKYMKFVTSFPEEVPEQSTEDDRQSNFFITCVSDHS